MEQDPDMRFLSIHQYPWYPGTGAASEGGVGNVFNIPAPPSLAPERYVTMLEEGFRRAIADWRPDLLLISAGYDSLHGDPLGGFTLEPAHLAGWVTSFRRQLPDVPVVGVLEGGYIPSRLADGVLATLDALD
jgi:acetoin utilization deacetylase AcuC-like enzyme